MILKDAFILSAISQSTKSSRFKIAYKVQRLAFHAGLIKKPAIITLVSYLPFPGIFVVFVFFCFIQQILSYLSKTESVATPDQYWCSLISLENCLQNSQSPGSSVAAKG